MPNKTFLEVVQQLIQVNDDFINKKIDIETARQVAINTQVIVNAAKVQIEFIKLSGGKTDGFFESLKLPDPQLNKPQKNQNQAKEPDKEDEQSTSRKSCEKCINYKSCLAIPLCEIDKYTHFKRAKNN